MNSPMYPNHKPSALPRNIELQRGTFMNLLCQNRQLFRENKHRQHQPTNLGS